MALVVETTLVVGVATNFNVMALNPIKASNTDFSVTFSRSASTVESGSYASGVATISSKLSGGTKVFADISGHTISGTQDIARFNSKSNQYVNFYFSDSNVTRFQSITSLDFTYTSYAGNFDIYYSTIEINFGDSSTYSKLEIYNAPSSVAISAPDIHYVALHGRVDIGQLAYFNSIKINYTCGG